MLDLPDKNMNTVSNFTDNMIACRLVTLKQSPNFYDIYPHIDVQLKHPANFITDVNDRRFRINITTTYF